MDKTPKYTMMSKRAEKIQYKHKYEEGDWFCWQWNVVCLGHYVPIGENIVTAGGYDYDFQDIDYADCIWLPTQAQLQKMVNRSNYPFGLLFDLHDFVRKLPVCVTSMEQLWLVFVMKKKYGKIWDDKQEKWV